MSEIQYIGITEAGDPAFNLDIFDKLYDGNIIITKSLTDKLIEKLIENKDKCLLHFTVTGHGGDILEPFVPTVEQSVKKFKKLIDNGFPIKQVVLRIDPIIPTDKGTKKALNVLEAFKEFGIERVRISFLDMYKHVKERFDEIGLKHPYEDFHAPLVDRKLAFKQILNLSNELGYSTVETCGEPSFPSTPCLSQKDVNILNLTDKVELKDNKGQRKTCGCPSNKKELIKKKPTPCQHKCLYCFWQSK